MRRVLLYVLLIAFALRMRAGCTALYPTATTAPPMPTPLPATPAPTATSLPTPTPTAIPASHHYELGVELARQGQYGAAIEAFDRAIALAADDPDAYLSRGVA